MSTAQNHYAIDTIGGKVYVVGGRIGGPRAGTASDLGLTEEYNRSAI
jgi:hypothetical protein